MPKNTPAPLWVSQNFLTSPALIDRLLRLSNINKAAGVAAHAEKCTGDPGGFPALAAAADPL